MRMLNKIRTFIVIFYGLSFLPVYSCAQEFVAAESHSNKIDVLDFKNIEIFDAFKFLSLKSGINMGVAETVQGRLSVYLKDITVFEAIDIIVDLKNLSYVNEGNVIKIMTAADFENKYGHPFGKPLQTKIIRLTDMQPNHVIGLLNQLKSPKGTLIHDPYSKTIIIRDEPDIIHMMEPLVETFDVSLETKVFRLSYAKPQEITEKIKGLLSEGLGTVYQDEQTNSLVVSDQQRNLRKIEGLIEAFDQKQSEVFIEAKIIQVVLNDEHRMGIDWAFLVKGYHGLNGRSNFDDLGGNDKLGRMGVGVLADDGYSFLIKSLESLGETNILSNPRIIAVNRQEAKILVGSTEPYVTATTTTPSAGPATTAESVNFIEVGVKLYATPVIHDDGFITLKIKPEVSSVTRTVVTANDNTIPVVETSQAETTVMVKDNTTIIIGGLIKDESIAVRKQVPLFGRLPYVGAAFRNDETIKRKTEIVIFLTPRIISGEHEDFVRSR